MKAIVAEIDKKHMIAITEKGDFVKVKRKLSAGIGDEIELKPQNTAVVYRRLAAMAACLMMVVSMTTGVYAYYTPYSYVSVDINPSVALTLNRFDRVISADPLTEDAVKLIEAGKGLKNQEIDDAITQIIKSASENGYIDPESESNVVVVISAKNPKQESKLISEVGAAASGELAKVSESYDVMVEKTGVSSYKAAVANKVSPGKEILAAKLKEVMPELKDEEIDNLTVRETAKLIKEGRKALKEEVKGKDNKGKNDDSKGKGNGKAAAENKDNKDNPGAVKINGASENDNKGNGKATVTSDKQDDDDKDKAKDKEKDKDKNGKGNGNSYENSNGQNNGSDDREGAQSDSDDGERQNGGNNHDDKDSTEKGNGSNNSDDGKDKKDN